MNGQRQQRTTLQYRRNSNGQGRVYWGTEIKEVAKDLYLSGNSLTEISSKLNIPKPTLRVCQYKDYWTAAAKIHDEVEYHKNQILKQSQNQDTLETDINQITEILNRASDRDKKFIKEWVKNA